MHNFNAVSAKKVRTALCFWVLIATGVDHASDPGFQDPVGARWSSSEVVAWLKGDHKSSALGI